MKYIIIMLLMSTFLFTSICFAQKTIHSDDLSTIIGEWKGSLTYIDYKTNKPFTMPADMLIENGRNNYEFKLYIEYPKERNANSTDNIKISKDGTKINKADIISIEKLSDEEIKIITQNQGKDNKEKAEIRMIYILGNTKLIIRKEVKFENTEDWLLRNEYNFKQ